MIALSDYYVKKHSADISNIKYGGDKITRLGDTITLSVYEAEDKAGLINTSLHIIFQKIADKVERCNDMSDRFIENVFARATAAKTFLVSKFQYVLSNLTLYELPIQKKYKHK